MGVGDEIIKQQLFFRKELRERVYWFIRLRWGAAGIALLAIDVAWTFNLNWPYGSLLLIVAAITAYNAVFVAVGHRLSGSGPEEFRSFEFFAHAQICLDLAALYCLVLLTRGVSSPLLIFFIFHVILAGILLSPLSCYFYALLIIGGVGLLAIWPAASETGDAVPFGLTGPAGGLVSYLIFSAGILIASFLITSVKKTLRFKGRELMKVSRELDLTNAKLTLLIEMIREVNSHSKLKQLMDSAVKNAADIMGVKACSIKLLDSINNSLKFAATYGLSLDYLSKDSISLEQSAVNRRIIEGSLYAIAGIDEAEAFQYPENIRQEGIGSMLCLPLKVEQKILGVFCVYSEKPDYFVQADADFFALMTDLTALAMEDRFRESDKTWFLNKAAHQLRAPLSTIQSMLQVIEHGYLGQVAPQQKETLLRCLARLKQLQDIINDLLKLAAGRQESDALKLKPIRIAPLLDSILKLYQDQVSARGQRLIFNLSSDDPLEIMGQEKLLDDVLTNLISNAVKYTPPGGTIEVHLARTWPETVFLEVRDTGLGIAEKDLPHLFTEFFRAENAKKEVEEGSGLGLVIVKEALDALGGRIEVQSRLGKGTTVRCYFRAANRGE